MLELLEGRGSVLEGRCFLLDEGKQYVLYWLKYTWDDFCVLCYCVHVGNTSVAQYRLFLSGTDSRGTR